LGKAFGGKAEEAKMHTVLRNGLRYGLIGFLGFGAGMGVWSAYAPDKAPSVPATQGALAAPPPAGRIDGAGTLSLAGVVDRITPAVVNVSVKARSSNAALRNPFFQDPNFRWFFPMPERMPPEERASVGSGVIIDAAKGHVVTNAHVVDHASEIIVTLKDRRELKAMVLGLDKDTDLALLKIDAADLTAVPLGDVNNLRVGDYVIAVGNPFGLGQTVTSGIVSALGRSGLNIEGYEDFIQTDAAINPGNSGGALINLNGELVGINTAIIGPAGGNVGVGFAVPTSMMTGVVQQLAEHGEVRRGRIGVEIRDLTPALADNLGIKGTEGALVSKVEEDSPADRAGLKTGDVVIGLDEQPVTGSSQLRNRIGLVPPGRSVKLAILRGGDRKEFEVSVEKRAVQQVTLSEDVGRLAGATLEAADEGVAVIEVAPNSPAWRAGLRKGDRIVAVNRQPVSDPAEVEKRLSDSGGQTALFVQRGGQEFLLIV
jgi:Do/DeqQ family serine protease